ncbi:unnamed protein product [Symbiodinium pilosum]|uniref:Uncharacterized protein n=1 Tax=Symbiodinium pilosum TaxID=2952 RepID=A0A812XIZ1_SYMPI|nr:unnamed protein product [Symbiodinium pilosum]
MPGYRLGRHIALMKITRLVEEDRERAEDTALALALASEPDVEEELVQAEPVEPSSVTVPAPQTVPSSQTLSEPVEPVEDEASVTKQATDTRKLSDVRQRRDERVRWDVVEPDDEPAPATTSDWQDMRAACAGRPLGRASMYMHHITAPWKQKFILQVASSAGLSGRCLFGKPGRILVEGPIEIVEKYTKKIESWPWKTCDLQGPWKVEERAFDAFDQLGSNSEFKKAVAQAGLSQELRALRSGA